MHHSLPNQLPLFPPEPPVEQDAAGPLQLTDEQADALAEVATLPEQAARGLLLLVLTLLFAAKAKPAAVEVDEDEADKAELAELDALFDDDTDEEETEEQAIAYLFEQAQYAADHWEFNHVTDNTLLLPFRHRILPVHHWRRAGRM